MAKFSIGIIGCGRISQSYIEAIRRSPHVVLSAVYDIRRDAATAVAEQEKAECFYDFDLYLEQSKVEASIILTPPSLHKNIACTLLEQGQHVLCEKPLAPTFQEGKLMLEAAKRNHKLLMMASKFRYVEDIIRTKSIISSGMIGKPVFIENCFSGRLDMKNRWNAKKEISGGGVLIDNGTHSVDLVRYLIGPIERVRAVDISTMKGLEVEDTVLVSFMTKNEIKGSIALSWNIPLVRKSYVSIYGTEGSLLVDWHQSNYQYFNNPEWVPFGVGYDKIAAFQRQVENFVAAISGQEVPLITWQDSLSSIAVIEAAYRSLNSGQWEEVAFHDTLK